MITKWLKNDATSGNDADIRKKWNINQKTMLIKTLPRIHVKNNFKLYFIFTFHKFLVFLNTFAAVFIGDSPSFSFVVMTWALISVYISIECSPHYHNKASR